MSKKTMKQFVKDGKPKHALFAISLEDKFAWAMISADGDVCSYQSTDMKFSTLRSFPNQITQLEDEMTAMLELVGQIDGIVMRVPTLKDTNTEISLRRVICIGVIKAFFGMHNVPFLPVETKQISEKAVAEAARISKESPEDMSCKDELLALEALIEKTTPPEKQDDGHLDLNGEIKFRKAGAA